MSFKKQVNKLKENWLIVVLVLVVVVVLNGNFFGNGINLGFEGMTKTMGFAQNEIAYDSGSYRGNGDFAPEVEERIKTVTSSLSSEVERGEFIEAETLMRHFIGNYDAFLLNENVRKNEEGFFETSYGSYTIKVDMSKYDRFISDLKEIGEVQSFNENTDDITGQYTNLEIELELEKGKLVRYNELYSEAEEIEDKITLENMIANQERTIKYLEDRLDNLDKRIDYATIYFSINEERCEYANITFVKLSELVRGFVNSVNDLLRLLFVVIPWAIGLLIVWKVYKKFKK